MEDENLPVNRLWLLDVFSSEPATALTTDEYCVRGHGDCGTPGVQFNWSPNSQEIAFSYTQKLGWGDFRDSSLASVNVITKTISPWEKRARYEALPRYSPDGATVAYLCDDSSETFAFNRQVAIRRADGKEPRLLPETQNEGVFTWTPLLLEWAKEGDTLLFFEPRGTKYRISLLPVDGGEARELETGSVFFHDAVLSPDKTLLGFVVEDSDTPPEVFVSKMDAFEPKQVSTLNEPLCAYSRTKTEVVSWKSKDGLKIEGLLTYPVNYREAEHYPLLVEIHGGPASCFSEFFLGTPSPLGYPRVAFAEAGFFILRPNPRGSTGYGKKFRCANYHDLGGMDLADVMTGVDALIAKGLVNERKLGIMGWSYGGYLAARAITQTPRFQAASLGAGIYNFVDFQWAYTSEYLGPFVNNQELYRQRSPFYHIHNISTPCLIIQGAKDEDALVSQSHEFYQALREAGKRAELVLYPGMGHSLSNPNTQLDAMERNLAWFKDNIKEKP
jgi:dipeptidyl aminopeptidase/acylaminoacyl peptidase